MDRHSHSAPDENERPDQTPTQPSGTKRAPLPSWLRAELGEYEPIPPALPSSGPGTGGEQGDKRTQEPEVARLHTESQAYRQALAHLQRRTDDVRSRSLEQRRGGCLTSWLVFLSIIVALETLFLCSDVFSFSKNASSFGHDTANALQGAALIELVFVVFVVISINGLWKLQRWGYYLQVVLYLLVILLEIVQIAQLQQAASSLFMLVFGPDVSSYIAIAEVKVAISVISLIILSLLVLARWDEFE